MAEKNAADVLDRLGDRWKGIIERAVNLDAVRREGPAGEAEKWPGDRDYGAVERLRTRLLKEYAGKRIDDVFAGREVRVEEGSCYEILDGSTLSVNVIDQDTARDRLLTNLKLLYGIGGVTEDRLKAMGYATIPDLVGHPKYGGAAQNFLRTLEKDDPGELNGAIRRYFPGSHPLAFYCSSFHDLANMVILDIETMGLFAGTPIILLGVARLDAARVTISQYLVRDIQEEVAVLRMFLSHLRDNSFFVTFNGKSFDIPYIKARMAYYGLRAQLDLPHYDMLHFAKRAWRDMVPDCRLTTLEGHLFNHYRDDDVPSELVPSFYETYLKTKNIGTIVPIIDHNKQDLITLARIFAKLHEAWK